MPGSIAKLMIGSNLGRWGGARENVQIQGGVSEELSVGITALRRDLLTVPPRMKHTWERVAMHMAAGYRLRAALRNAKAPALERAGLVLERSGTIAHASEPLAEDRDLRERLRDCARAVDYARGRLAKDAPQQAVDL
ncbi:MAG TPA: hypothetical protein VM580_01930 [Labilithrix sp.]|nr:hypothetical protein [Labilithrix sp.]